MQTSVTINGVDLALLGLAVREVRGYWDGPTITGDGVKIPLRPGQLVPTPSMMAIAPRTIDIVGTLIGDDRTDYLARLEFLKTVLVNRALRIQFAEQPERYFTGRAVGTAVTPTGPIFLQRKQTVSISLVCDDPYAYDMDELVMDFAATPVAIALGTAPSAGVIRLLPASEDPVLTRYNAAAEAIETLEFTVTLSTGDYVDVDLDRCLISHVIDGADPVDGLALLTAGNLPSFVFSPNDIADEYFWPEIIRRRNGALLFTDAFPMISVSDGSAQLRYRRAWS